MILIKIALIVYLIKSRLMTIPISEFINFKLFSNLTDIDGTQRSVSVNLGLEQESNLYFITDSRDFYDFSNGEKRVLPIRIGHEHWLKSFNTEILNHFSTLEDKIELADIGCGSGIGGIYYAKLLQNNNKRVKCSLLDLNPRALEYSELNISLNSFNRQDFALIESPYLNNSFESESIDLLMLDPPYHPHPSFLSSQTTPHANGGNETGFGVFHDWIKTAKTHLKTEALLNIDMMSTGLLGQPQAVLELINQDYEVLDIVDFYPPLEFKLFLKLIYEDVLVYLENSTDLSYQKMKTEIVDWIEEISSKHKNNYWHFNIILAKNSIHNIANHNSKLISYRENSKPISEYNVAKNLYNQRLEIHKQIIKESIFNFKI